MSFFGRNTDILGQYNAGNIIPDESYYGESGALRIALEGLQNDQAIFEALISQDFEEGYRLQEGSINESQIIALQEGVISDFVARIKELVKKIAEKIKGLFHSFIVRVNSVIIRDNKKFVEKYRRDVLSKDLSKMKYKWSKPTGNIINLPAAVDEIDSAITDISGANSETALGKKEDFLNDDFADKFFGRMVSGADEESFEKDAHELYFDDEDEEEGLATARVTEIMSRLINSKDTLKDLEKVQKDADKAFTKYLSAIDKHVNGMAKSIPNSGKDDYGTNGKGKTKMVDTTPEGGKSKPLSYAGGNENTKNIVMKQLVLIQKTVTKTQGLFARAASKTIIETKFGMAQDRRVFAKAAAYNAKSVKESAIFEAYAEEAAVYDIMSSFEAPGMN